MAYYIIKTHYIPSETNTREDAFEHDYYTGKKESSLNTETWFTNMRENKPWICEYTMETYAYKRLADAKRALKSHKESNQWETSQGHWVVDSEIMKVEL